MGVSTGLVAFYPVWLVLTLLRGAVSKNEIIFKEFLSMVFIMVLLIISIISR